MLNNAQNKRVLRAIDCWLDIQSVVNRNSTDRTYRIKKHTSACARRTTSRECTMISLNPIPTKSSFAIPPDSLREKLLEKMERVGANADGKYIFDDDGVETREAIEFLNKVMQKKLSIKIPPRVDQFELGPMCQWYKSECVDFRNFGAFEGGEKSLLLRDGRTRILETFMGPLLPVSYEVNRIYAHVFNWDGMIAVGFPVGIPLRRDFLYSTPMKHFFTNILTYIMKFEENAVFCGHSMGCALALHAALIAFELDPAWFAQKLVVVGSGSTPTLREEDAKKFINLPNIRLFYAGLKDSNGMILCDNKSCDALTYGPYSIVEPNIVKHMYLPSLILTAKEYYRIDGNTNFYNVMGSGEIELLPISQNHLKCKPDKHTAQHVVIHTNFHGWDRYAKLLKDYSTSYTIVRNTTKLHRCK